MSRKAASSDASRSATGAASDRAERERLLERIDAGAPEAAALADWMAEHPELSMEERETSARYRAYLAERGFEIEERVGGMETAFVARHGAPDAAIRAALLAEMDALPGIGHACGHNLSGPASLLAASALAAELPPDAARIVVVGCPAEETGMGKPALVKADVFRDVDVAMMAHASDMRRAHRLFLGNRKLDFVYHGRAAHAAAYPERGINALDAVVAFYTSVGLLRQQLPRDARVHIIISEGGAAPNIIPERAAAKVWVRALENETLQETTERVRACARAAAESTGTRLEELELQGASPPMRPNLALADTYRHQLDALDYVETSHAPHDSIGSSDITHISRVVPTIHPNFPIGEDLQLHTRAFADATRGPKAMAGLVEGARCMALTVRDLARSPELRERVKADWRASAD